MSETIPGLLAVAAERAPYDEWIRTDDGTLSFGAAAAAVARLADRLRDAGIARGDLVLVTARTTPPYLLTWFALATIGAVTVATDPKATPDELSGLIGQVRPRAVISDAGINAPISALDVDQLAGDWHLADPGGRLDVTVTPDDLATLIPTSGTTGRSKLVMQTHRAYHWAGVGFPYWMGLSSSDRLMTSLPLFHINAPAYSVMGSLAAGAGLVLVPRFSASGFLDTARRHGATEFNAIGAMLEILWRQPRRPDDADNPLRLCYTGPSPARSWQEAFEERFGLQIICGYAMSETPYGLIWRHGTRPFGTLGSVRQHPIHGIVNQARVIDDDDQFCGPGQTGELYLHNPVVTPGYWNMPDETAAAITDGWMHTGDLVTVNDDDTYTFVSRKKEVLRRRGLNLAPAEVEEAIAAHPAVLEVAVVGVPSELTEDEIKAFVVATPGHTVDFNELRGWTGERVSAFKVPRFWQLIDALPRTPTARVAKHRLPGGHPDGEYDAAPGPR
jgi:crotonobetaine/carnitine-CoA ligase